MVYLYVRHITNRKEDTWNLIDPSDICNRFTTSGAGLLLKLKNLEFRKRVVFGVWTRRIYTGHAADVDLLAKCLNVFQPVTRLVVTTCPLLVLCR